MSTREKLKIKLLDGKKLKFVELQHLLIAYGFELLRVKGDHFIYARQDIGARANIQPERNGDAKAYQQEQIREIFVECDL